MGFWSRLFGSPPAVDESLIPMIQGPGSFQCPVVGESHYQAALEAICGGRTSGGVNHEVTAVLILEDDNPHDANAVRVVVQGQTVGYLSRDLAPTFRRTLRDSAGGDLHGCRVAGVIRGGWDRGDRGRGHFGIWLDVPMTDDGGPVRGSR